MVQEMQESYLVKGGHVTHLVHSVQPYAGLPTSGVPERISRQDLAIRVKYELRHDPFCRVATNADLIGPPLFELDFDPEEVDNRDLVTGRAASVATLERIFGFQRIDPDTAKNWLPRNNGHVICHLSSEANETLIRIVTAEETWAAFEEVTGYFVVWMFATHHQLELFKNRDRYTLANARRSELVRGVPI